MSVMAEQAFASKLRERREQVKLDQAGLAERLGVPVAELADWEQGRHVGDLSLAQLMKLAEVLGTSLEHLAPDVEDDLDAGVLIQRPEDRSVLKGVRGGVDYYVYHCLVRTRQVPSLVPLVVDVLVDDPAEAKFNDGHAGNEFIYVLSGEIHMKWGDPARPHEAVLPTGSSLYLQPYVRHAFTAARGSGPARLLAVNF
ncbi:helix-turn-helix domain-containing protein [Micromonospora cathayae]|uniref:Helix-turn-helix domain-containing protein n=1 Tax=Micromonospora cathayae TaxID=3028804 RepID=A0ABY7ZS26_9ACTN|nr:helix-turn-helix domain-containing protein [Micromonospora sp. HUAS 3]WDZ85836.1 helix-turn-helix domain-containing protein [Micromonospora sp. HUAS 3]